MGKATRKPHPDVPYFEWLDRDGCWFCKHHNNCNQCKANKNFYKSRHIHKYKGAVIGSIR